MVRINPEFGRADLTAELNPGFAKPLDPFVRNLFEQVGQIYGLHAQNFNTGVRARKRKQLFDQLGHLRRILQDPLAGLAVIIGIPRESQGDFGFSTHKRDRGPEFVCCIGREGANALVPGFNAAQHLIQSIGQCGKLVARLEHGQAAVEVFVVDALRLGCNSGDR